MDLWREALEVRWGSGEQIWIEELVEEGFWPGCEWKGGGQRSSTQAHRLINETGVA